MKTVTLNFEVEDSVDPEVLAREVAKALFDDDVSAGHYCVNNIDEITV